MPIRQIDRYLHSVLGKQLVDHGLLPTSMDAICGNIRTQIISLASMWESKELLHGLLLIGQEEGQFYIPSSEINPFVVVAVRNSLLETYHCKNNPDPAIPNGLPNEVIAEITAQAISCFSRVDFTELSRACANDDAASHYPILCAAYPVAWKALVQLSNCDGTSCDYPAAKSDFDHSILARSKRDGAYNLRAANTVVLDGYSEEIDPMMASILYDLKADKTDMLYTPNLKMISRNTKKLLLVLEYVLTLGKPYVSFNYYLSNGHVERRKKLISGRRSTALRIPSPQELDGTSGNLRNTLRGIVSSLSRQ